jgi:hypothetical protein
MGIKEDTYEMEGSESREFYVSMVLRHRVSNYRWELATIYSLAQHENAGDFIVDLSRKCIVATLPIVLGGDFNLIRNTTEKNTPNFNHNLMDKFNMFIDLRQLQELKRNDPKYT